MALLKGIDSFFGLDIGYSSIRLVELAGHDKVKTLVKYAHAPLDVKISQSDAKADQVKLAEIVRNLIAEARVTTKDVAVNVPSNRVFTAVVDVDKLSKKELTKSIHYQIGTLIPTAIEKSKIDWEIIGESPKDPNKNELLISSVGNDFTERRMDTLESIGLNVIAFEPDNLALARSLVDPNAKNPQMVINIDTIETDLVIVMNGIPRLIRSITVGTDAIIKTAAQNLGVDIKQAEELVYKFGVDKNKLEGRLFQAIVSTIDLLISEIEKSIKFFEARYVGNKIERIIVTGGASTLPEFPVYAANKFGINIEIGNAWRNVVFPADRQNELLAVSSSFGVATGLAERNEYDVL